MGLLNPDELPAVKPVQCTWHIKASKGEGWWRCQQKLKPGEACPGHEAPPNIEGTIGEWFDWLADGGRTSHQEVLTSASAAIDPQPNAG